MKGRRQKDVGRGKRKVEKQWEGRWRR